MTSGTEWQLDQLFAMFPDVSRGTDRMLRCLWRTTGEGRCIKERAGVRLSAAVSLTARPGARFVLRLTNTWPSVLAAADRQSIESELLRGILEGTVSCEDPPWRCQLECSSVSWSPVGQGGMLVRTAAALAVQDLVGGGGWEAVGSPGDHVA
jgi:hypothetical protein